MVDAEGERLGRLATRVAALLQGKHRPDYSRHQLSDDFVIVVNAAKVGVSGNKMSQKLYYRHSGYSGGLRTRTLEEMLTRFPERVIELAVKGMLPRNRIGRRMLRRLKVYTASTHPHEAQIRIGMGKAKQAPAAATAQPGVSAAAAAEEEAAQAAAESAEAEEEAPQSVDAAEEVAVDDEPEAAAAEEQETEEHADSEPSADESGEAQASEDEQDEESGNR